MQANRNYSDLSSVLIHSLDLQQSPIAISFADVVPAGVKQPSGPVAAGCKFWEHGADQVFATTAVDHSLCAIGVYTHNLQPSPAQQTDLLGALKIFAELDYVTQQDLEAIPVLATRPAYVVYAPLASTPLPPDVVLLFVNARQTLILAEATQQVEKQQAPAMGRPACAIVPQVMKTGRAALSLGCCGARAYLDVLTDGTAMFALPGATLEAYTERIEALAKANSLLTNFHHLRRRAVQAGETPSIQDSLAAMASDG